MLNRIEKHHHHINRIQLDRMLVRALGIGVKVNPESQVIVH